jgi:PAS domain S-box-containing protein
MVARAHAILPSPGETFGASSADVDEGYIYHVAIEEGRVAKTEHGPGCLAVTGFSSEELRADPLLWIAMVPEADRELVREYAERLRMGQQAPPIVHRILRKDGTIRLVRNGATLLHSSEGQLRGYLGRIEDVTDARDVGESASDGFVHALQRMEQALVHSEQRARSFLEASPMGVHLFDLEPDGRLVFVGANKAADRILGVDNSQFVGQEIERAFPALCDTEAPERFRRAAEQGESWWTQVIHYREQNISGAYEVYAFQIQPRSMAALFLDVSERLKMDEALRVSEERHRQFLENFQGIAYIVTLPGGAVAVMDGLVEEISGYGREDFIGGRVGWLDLVVPEDRPGWLEDAGRLAQQSEAAQTADREYRIKDRSGRLHWVRDIARVVGGGAGSGRAIHGAIYDVTQRRRSEEERLQLEARLRQQQKLESLGTLAAGVAHEINNPLTGILNYAELLASRLPAAEPLRGYADSIIRESERVSEIVKHLLAFSRQDRQQRSPARLCDVVAETMTLVRALFRKDQIRLEVAVAEDLPVVKCRSQEIQQVLLNLLTNARDALNERFAGGGADERKRVALSAARLERKGRAWLRLTVADTGIGVPADIRERIFDPFFTTKARDVGTGLGLAVSYGIVKAHHGELLCESEPGQGTRFHLDLPIDNDGEAEPREHGVA